MAIEFKKEIRVARLLDPANHFAEAGTEFEVRTDPLTQRKSYVYQLQHIMPEKRDLSPIIQKSLEKGCPFCPEAFDRVIPKFIPELVPEGRLRVGEACAFPNQVPYAAYGALVLLARAHFVGLTEFTPEMVINGLIAGQTYLKRVQQYDAQLRYFYIGWNYMPQSGGSQIHPHLHANADYYPYPYQQELVAASRDYYLTNGANFWPELIAREQELGERYIGNTGSICWLLPFAPRGRLLDILAVFQQRSSFLDVTESEIRDFASGLARVFRYMHEQNFHSFNLTINSEVAGDSYFWMQARIVPRCTFGTEVSDCAFYEFLQDFHFAYRSPEINCREFKKYF